jgi:ornithine carbamoyltransferase
VVSAPQDDRAIGNRTPEVEMKDLLRIADLSRSDLRLLLDIADESRGSPRPLPDVLARQSVIAYFAEPSTRTRLSFGSAVARLGGTMQSVGPAELRLGCGETIEDAAEVISRYARAFVVGTFADDDVRRFAAAASIPVVNARTDGHHPCQALADLMTLRRHFGRLDGLHVAYVGDGNNVAHSLLEACALAGVDISVATPPRYEPSPEVIATAERLSVRSGSAVFTTHDPLLAVAEANAVYTDVWLSMGTADDEREERSAAFAPYRVDDALMAEAARDAIVMHCLPAHRGDEVTASVIDGRRSVVFDQAENRMHTAVAVLRCLIEGSLHGACLVEQGRRS